ncbi:hypothetical protein ACTWPT_06885 [Nonomuraea sp. 3N208]|uniref:hypothetical protein n=1 Tax=Nonomuraea sp. 3N208 TaxID=3457421 RepID=UPI003FCD0F50
MSVRLGPVRTDPLRSEGTATALSRRTFIATTTAVGDAAATAGLAPGTSAAATEVPAEAPPTSRVSLSVNGDQHTVLVDNRTGAPVQAGGGVWVQTRRSGGSAETTG